MMLMPKKKVEVVELNKVSDEIILEENQSSFIIFLKKYGKWLLIIALLLLITLGYTLFKYISDSKEFNINQISLDDSLNDYNATVNSSSYMTDERAKNKFLKNDKFSSDGEVLLVKTVESDKFIIWFFSDGTAIKINKNGNLITRIGSLENGEYGIDSLGVINTKATISDVTVKDIKTYPYGTVTYYSDGSAMITDSKMDMFVRNANDVHDNYISNNKVSYLKETNFVGNARLNYYYDGTIEIIKDNISYIIRNEKDILINNNNITFPNENNSKIISTKKLDDGYIIDYYEDGGAIIRDGSKTISVRKSNSIIIENNKIKEIVDNIYVTISKSSPDGKITYYTNGGSVIEYNGEKIYVDENSNIKYHNDTISNVDGKTEKLAGETKTDDGFAKLFEETAVIEKNGQIIIVPKSSVIFDKDGNIKDIDLDNTDDGTNGFKITNNTDKTVKFRVVIEESSKTNLDSKYIKYQLSVKDTYIEPTFLNTKLWKNDKLNKSLSISGTNYILVDSEIAPRDEAEIKLMVWTDYETIPNSMQDKYFYGTIKVYSWTEE